MRTTLTIDDDLAGILKRRSAELDLPFKEVVNSALRKGLTSETDAVSPKAVRTRPHDFGTRPGIDWDRMNQLVDELEADTFAEKHLGK